MANWLTSVNKSGFDAGGQTSDLTKTREQGREKYKTGSVSGKDLAGINANQAQNMMQAIVNYIEAIQGKIDEIDANANSNSAVKGEAIQTALTNYINKVKGYCKDLVDYLKAFNDKLEEVLGQWVKQTAASAEAINKTASSGGNFYDNVGKGYSYHYGAQSTIDEGYGQGTANTYANQNYNTIIGSPSSDDPGTPAQATTDTPAPTTDTPAPTTNTTGAQQ